MCNMVRHAFRIQNFLTFASRIRIRNYYRKARILTFSVQKVITVKFRSFDPGSGMGKKIQVIESSGSGSRDKHPGSYFRELRNLNSVMRIRIRDPESF